MLSPYPVLLLEGRSQAVLINATEAYFLEITPMCTHFAGSDRISERARWSLHTNDENPIVKFENILTTSPLAFGEFFDPPRSLRDHSIDIRKSKARPNLARKEVRQWKVQLPKK